MTREQAKRMLNSVYGTSAFKNKPVSYIDPPDYSILLRSTDQEPEIQFTPMVSEDVQRCCENDILALRMACWQMQKKRSVRNLLYNLLTICSGAVLLGLTIRFLMMLFLWV